MSIARRVIRGIAWETVCGYGAFAVGFAAGIPVARLLEVEAFGVYASAASLLGLAKIATAWGVHEAIAKEDAALGPLSNVLLTLMLLFALGLVAVAVTVQGTVGRIYGRETALTLLLLAVFEGLGLLSQIPLAILKKTLMLKASAMIGLVSTILGAIVAVTMALAGCGLWTLIVREAFELAGTAAARFWFCPVRLRFGWDWRILSRFFRFGVHVFLNAVAALSVAKSDKAALGALAGTALVGIYTRAQQLADLFYKLIPDGTRMSVLPTYAAVKSDGRRLYQAYRLFTRINLFLVLPLYTVLAFLVKPMILFVYGQKWAPSAELFVWFVPAGLVLPVLDVNNALHFALGHSSRVSRVRLIALLVFLPTLVVGISRWGARGAAVAVSAFNVLSALAILWQSTKVFGVSRTYSVLARPLLCGLLALPVGYLARMYSAGWPFPMVLLLVLPTTVLAFLGLVFLLDRHETIQDIRLLMHHGLSREPG